jgi:hypothetical protein
VVPCLLRLKHNLSFAILHVLQRLSQKWLTLILYRYKLQIQSQNYSFNTVGGGNNKTTSRVITYLTAAEKRPPKCAQVSMGSTCPEPER